jgi:thiamine kinase-like enzyme
MPEEVEGPTAELQQIIQRVSAWTGKGVFQVEQIGGLTNTNYRVTVDGERFVLRVSGQNTAQLGIDRQQELAALHMVAAAGIAPQVVDFLLPEGHLVTRWAAGRHWEPAECRTPGHIRLLTETVRRIHALPPTAAHFSPFERVNAYQRTTAGYHVPFPSDFDTFLETMHMVQSDQAQDSSHWQRFCHNDLVAVNYLFDDEEQRIIVLDWEFSGLGDIYYDLATVVYTHDSEGPIPPELEEVMLACYFGEATPFQRRRLLGMKYMLMLFTGMWGLAQHGMQQAGLIPTVEGFDYLEFAQYLFAHDTLELCEQLDRARL